MADPVSRLQLAQQEIDRVAGNRLLDILERQKQLLGIELLRTAAELRALQLAQQMPQAINLRPRLAPNPNADIDTTAAL
jgi:hypothetical protein